MDGLVYSDGIVALAKTVRVVDMAIVVIAFAIGDVSVHYLTTTTSGQLDIT